jgi:hypothetical protein
MGLRRHAGSTMIDPAMREALRTELARRALAGYEHGPDAAIEATAEALRKADRARTVVLVEGISDQIALETLAARRGRNLEADRIVVVPVGGAHAVTGYLERFGPTGADLALAGLCDANEAELFRRALAGTGVGTPATVDEMARLGFHVCVDDLEDELIRAATSERVEALFASQGDLGAFRSLQHQPAWRGRAVDAQMRRFLGSGARRKLRYARLLVEAIPDDRIPRPLGAVLADLRSGPLETFAPPETG